MPSLEELKEKKNQIENEIDKPPHERDGRLFRHRTPRQRLRDLEQKIQKKKKNQEDKKRKKQTRRKLLLGAGFKRYLEEEEVPLERPLESQGWKDELEEDYPELFPSVFDVEEDPGDNAYNRRLIVLGGLIMRDLDPDDWESFLTRILSPDDDEWSLFTEMEDFPEGESS